MTKTLALLSVCGHYAANKGIVLLGKGNRTFGVLPPSQSGLALNEQVASLLYFEGSSPMLVVGANRDSVRVFRQKTRTQNL